jgi:prepilin-type N-terminal cleavage/methylation domain-containing protein
VVRPGQRGFTLLEVVVSMSIFATFLVLAFTLTSEMRRWEKKLPVNFIRNPQIISVIARMRRDVLDVQVPGNGKIYLPEYQGYMNGPKTLIIETGLPTGVQTVIWDFSEAAGLVQRRRQVGVGGARRTARVLGRRRHRCGRVRGTSVRSPAQSKGRQWNPCDRSDPAAARAPLSASAASRWRWR